MKNTELKKYIKAAKIRLRETEIQSKDNNDEVFYLNTHKLSVKELDRMDELIREIVACDEFVVDPLGRMIDNKVFDKLSENGKMKYLLDLSKIYLFLRTKIENKA